jgi:hypothetical protein
VAVHRKRAAPALNAIATMMERRAVHQNERELNM